MQFWAIVSVLNATYSAANTRQTESSTVAHAEIVMRQDTVTFIAITLISVPENQAKDW
jgi:hypothetical protein